MIKFKQYNIFIIFNGFHILLKLNFYFSLIQCMSVINFQYGTSKYFPSISSSQYFTANLYSIIYSSVPEIFTFYAYEDDWGKILIDGVTKSNTLYSEFVSYAVFTVDFSTSKFHNLYVKYQQSYGGASMSLEWSSPSTSRQIIPTSNYYITKLIGLSPFQITVSCPSGYYGNLASSPNAWATIWGDGIKAGSETCDDGTIF